MSVTVIDDVEGRDMPLLRAEVGSLDMTHESGPGMARYDMMGTHHAIFSKYFLSLETPATTAHSTSPAACSKCD